MVADTAEELSAGVWAQWSTQICILWGLVCGSQNGDFQEHLNAMYADKSSFASAQSMATAYQTHFADPDISFNATRYNLTGDAWQLLKEAGEVYNATSRPMFEKFIGYYGGSLMAKMTWGGYLQIVCSIDGIAIAEHGDAGIKQQVAIRLLNDVFAGGGGGNASEQAKWWAEVATCEQSVGGGQGNFADI